jgi:uncharacterized protein YcfJ
MNLYRFFKGEITIRPFPFIANMTKVHRRKGDKVTQLEPIKRFIEVDAEIIKGTTVQRRYPIQDIIKEYRHALS